MLAHGVLYLSVISVALAISVGFNVFFLDSSSRTQTRMREVVGQLRKRLTESRSSEQAARVSALSAVHELEEFRRQNTDVLQQNTRLSEQGAELSEQNTQLRQENEESRQACTLLKHDLDEKSETMRILEEKLNTTQFNYEAITKVAERYKNNWAEAAGAAEEFEILYRYFDGETMQLRRQRRTLNDQLVEERAREMKASIVQDTLLHAGSAGLGG